MTTDQRPVALITGASAGIGAAAAFELVRSGYRVVAMARSADKLQQLVDQIADEGGSATFVAGDMSSYEDMSSAVSTCEERFGRLDVLVNNTIA